MRDGLDRFGQTITGGWVQDLPHGPPFGGFGLVARLGGRTTNAEALPVLRQRLGGVPINPKLVGVPLAAKEPATQRFCATRAGLTLRLVMGPEIGKALPR